ncbi:MAG: serine/threonine protein kinase [Anaeromyxobacter sp.]|nr:serine/threonine protein kinase [Anaeromyxobacter sp.]MBL0274718.1 serine/threonine protein kinase [Anaeromyxobacter sp.]
MRAFGRYQLLEPIASGGMAEVWRARVAGPAGVEKEVALKLVRGEHGARSDFARMFLEEARLAARLTHANVVQVFELVEQDGRHAIAMELVRGRDLGRVVERCREVGARLGLPRALHLGVEVARALDYAHRLTEGGRPLGLVHRDVSPPNVLVSFEGEVKLADFGIARAMSQAGLTDPGTVKGKLAYMAPEQARGEPVDARADVFSLGVVVWELCAGRRLFARESDAATLAAVQGDAPVSPPSAWNEQVSGALDAAVLAALRRDPAERTATAGELGAALAAVLLGLVRTPEDVDLRAFMRRLWPDGEAGSGAPTAATAVRPVARSAGAGQREPAGPDAATRTVELPPPGAPPPAAAGSAAGRPGAGRLAARGAAVALAAVLAGLALRAGLAGDGPPATAAPAGAPAPGAGGLAAPGRGAAGPLEIDPDLDAEGQRRGVGRLVIAPIPLATVWVDGALRGDTPIDLELPAGHHLLQAANDDLGRDQLEVTVEAGRVHRWRPRLQR